MDWLSWNSYEAASYLLKVVRGGPEKRICRVKEEKTDTDQSMIASTKATLALVDRFCRVTFRCLHPSGIQEK
jgi:hypothetical protein